MFNLRESIPWPNQGRLALVVGSSSSEIGKTVLGNLRQRGDLDVVKTIRTKAWECLEGDPTGNNAVFHLDITDTKSVEDFVRDFSGRYRGQKLNTIFLNVGIPNTGDTITKYDFIRRVNMGDISINSHLNNLLLIERLRMSSITTPKTKVIYNASVQIFVPKDGFEDYSYMKSMVAALLLQEDRLDVTILCCSLIKGTAGSAAFEQKLEEKRISFADYIKVNMPDGQPTTEDVDTVTNFIMSHRARTKHKFILLDGGAFKTQYARTPEQFAHIDLGSLLFFNQQTKMMETFSGKVIR